MVPNKYPVRWNLEIERYRPVNNYRVEKKALKKAERKKEKKKKQEIYILYKQVRAIKSGKQIAFKNFP